MNQGYVKIYRKANDSGLFGHDLKVAGLFAWLLLRVNWKAEKWRGEWVHPGSMITSISHLAGMIYESPKVTKRLIAVLETEGILMREVRANRWTKLTICNWAAYQDLPCSEGKLRDSKGANQGYSKGYSKGTPIKELRINYKKENLIKEKFDSAIMENYSPADQKLLTEAAERILKIHPRVKEPQRTKCLIISAIHDVVDKGRSLSDAISYVEAKTQKYKTATDNWSADDRNYITGSKNFYANGVYLEKSEDWVKENCDDKFEVRDGWIWRGNKIAKDFTGAYDGLSFKNGKFTGHAKAVS